MILIDPLTEGYESLIILNLKYFIKFTIKCENLYQILRFIYSTFSKHKNTNLQIQLRLSSVNFEGAYEAYGCYKLWIFP